MSMEKSRNFLGVVYPDSESYSCDEVLVALDSCFKEWAFVLHDNDVDEDGNPKKPHYHWVGKRKTPVPISTVAHALGVPENSVEFCKKWKAAVRYLIHMDDPDKYSYDNDIVTSNFEVSKFLSDMSDLDMALKIMDYVKTERPSRVVDLMEWSMANGCWSEYRRSAGSWVIALNELKLEDKT